MSVFAEPSVMLCGAKSDSRYAVCCKTVEGGEDHEGDHLFFSVDYVAARLSQTFTPCKWLHDIGLLGESVNA